MRLAEFIVRVTTYHRQTEIALTVRLTLAVLFGMLGLAVKPLLEPMACQLVGEAWAPALASIPAIVGCVTPLVSFFPAMRRIERRFGVRCPRCRHDLQERRGTVIASRRCPHCGATVIDEP